LLENSVATLLLANVKENEKPDLLSEFYIRSQMQAFYLPSKEGCARAG
jgi:hypothetical protein